MSIGQPLLIAAVAIGLSCASLAAVIIITIEEQTFHTYTRQRDLGALLLASVRENVGYRQATAWWRLEGWWASLRGREQTWGTMTRQGFDDGSRARTEASAGD